MGSQLTLSLGSNAQPTPSLRAQGPPEQSCTIWNTHCSAILRNPRSPFSSVALGIPKHVSTLDSTDGLAMSKSVRTSKLATNAVWYCRKPGTHASRRPSCQSQCLWNMFVNNACMCSQLTPLYSNVQIFPLDEFWFFSQQPDHHSVCHVAKTDMFPSTNITV